jgi:hypothetical protein
MGVDPLQESYTKKSHFNRMTFFYEIFFVYYNIDIYIYKINHGYFKFYFLDKGWQSCYFS